MIRPFIKWAGGKRLLIKEISPRLPKDYTNLIHIEPFIGGGSVLLTLQPKSAIIRDYNKYLIKTYQAIREYPHIVIENLEKFVNDEETFYKTRKNFNQYKDMMPEYEIASNFIYLNKTCFNGLYRENRKGEYNTPYSKSKREFINMFNKEDILDTSKYLKEHVVILSPSTYNDIRFIKLNNINLKNTFWYLDPPYAPLDGKNNFVDYTNFNGWEGPEQIQLRNFCNWLNEKGAKFMLSNAMCTQILNLYEKYNIDIIDAPRSISSNGANRKSTKEVIVTNY